MKMKPTILYVEDDSNDAVCLERALKKSGLPLDLQIAPDGQFAVEYLLGEDQYADRLKYPLPQLIVTDMKMFRMGGLELLQWIRSNRRFSHLPVVLYSTSNEDIDVSHAALAGATAYFRKTYQCQEVVEFLRNWLKEESAVKEVKKAPSSKAFARGHERPEKVQSRRSK
jgi:CheY-like chemotaxis protein